MGPDIADQHTQGRALQSMAPRLAEVCRNVGSFRQAGWQGDRGRARPIGMPGQTFLIIRILPEVHGGTLQRDSATRSFR